MKNNFCITTIITPSFLHGSLVMLYSFKKYNTWFNGDFVMIYDESLDKKTKNTIEEHFNNIIWYKAPEKIRRFLIENQIEEYKTFYTLEIFNFLNYEKVLYCDSDILFRSSIDSFFFNDSPVTCCGDGAHYRGLKRSAENFNVVKKIEHDKHRLLPNSFNAGLLLINKELINNKVYNELLTFLKPSKWNIIKSSNHADQSILNITLAGKEHLFDCEYNYLLYHRALIQKKRGKSLKDAKVIHYNRSYKPWNHAEMLNTSLEDPALIKAYEYWYHEYFDFLSFTSIKKNI